jgi:hypothetical protein
VIVVKARTTAGGRVFSQIAGTASLDVRALESGTGATVLSLQKEAKAVARTAEDARQAAANEAGASAGAEVAIGLVAKEGTDL